MHRQPALHTNRYHHGRASALMFTSFVCRPGRREEVSKAALNKIRGVENHERIDEALYGDYESEEAKKASPPPFCIHAHSMLDP